MSAAKVKPFIEQGATFKLSFTWYLGSSTDLGDPKDLTGAVANMQIRQKLTTPALVSASSEGSNPRIILGGTAGTVHITLTDTDTDALVYTKAVFDLEIRTADGELHRLMQGPITVDLNVTRED